MQLTLIPNYKNDITEYFSNFKVTTELPRLPIGGTADSEDIQELLYALTTLSMEDYSTRTSNWLRSNLKKVEASPIAILVNHSLTLVPCSMANSAERLVRKLAEIVAPNVVIFEVVMYVKYIQYFYKDKLFDDNTLLISDRLYRLLEEYKLSPTRR